MKNGPNTSPKLSLSTLYNFYKTREFGRANNNYFSPKRESSELLLLPIF